jgi:hypothetical protein
MIMENWRGDGVCSTHGTHKKFSWEALKFQGGVARIILKWTLKKCYLIL